nr:hypothetical protein [Burkholderia pyrrocinia]
MTSETESGYGVPGLEYFFYWHRSADQDRAAGGCAADGADGRDGRAAVTQVRRPAIALLA